ncbi:hypothetical protein Pst134EA_006729 [Puccinia striiformis f. sp. tritici]|uniref:hypothetical protein n=1 Tax=Puccinia striiformis f. sp. tritici TaxID=168172 RepID=UPI0020079DC9|nr:hypothetical protein Pst134EA_006729 [Puccinia striiformis f. sp. tritici]KAH9469440.1 hypothetical protein Pst134EA_006729 [Puccinia striiformis f. sp. tritici]
MLLLVFPGEAKGVSLLSGSADVIREGDSSCKTFKPRRVTTIRLGGNESFCHPLVLLFEYVMMTFVLPRQILRPDNFQELGGQTRRELACRPDSTCFMSMIGCDYHDDTGSYIDSLVSREPPEIVSVASLSQSAWIEPRRYITSDKPQPTPSTVENMSTPSDQLYQLSVQDESTGRKLTLELTRTGLTMHKLLVESSEFPTRDVLCGPESSSSFKTEGRKFMNQIVGRYANRLPAGKSILIDSSRLEGKDIELNLDENEPIEGGRGNCLHSGYDGYDLREFERVDDDSSIVQEFRSTNTEETTTANEEFMVSSSAYYHLHSPSGDQGLPEAIDILANVTLELSPATEGLTQTIPSKTGPKTRIGRARFSLKAKLSDPEEVAKRNAGTPINLTWHTGYILNDFREEPSDPDGIHQHKLWINSDRHLAVHESQLPTGEIHSNEALGIDFSTPDPFSEEGIKPIGETMPSGGFGKSFSSPRARNRCKECT